MKKPWNTRKNRGGKHRKNRLVEQSPPVFQAPQSRFGPNGKPGTRPQAVIIDMDGTLENWDGKPNPPGLEYALKHHSEGRVLVILTARDHEYSYRHTHDWLVRHLDVPFVGPICRPADDGRYACDFKRAVHDQLSSVYEIVSAIDDDHYVLDMWRSIPGLEVIETSYSYERKGPVRSVRPELDLDIWEPDEDELDWLSKYSGEIKQAKRRKPRFDWDNEIKSMDIYCHMCEHPWFDHDVTGCTAVSDCVCTG